MKKYEKEPFEFLTDSQLDDLLKETNHSMSDDNQEAIKNKVHEKIQNKTTKEKKIIPLKRKRMWQYGIAAAVVLIMLVGFTQRDTIKMAYVEQFGSESDKLLLHADKLKESAEDQGLKLTAKSSFKDGDSTYVFMTLQDLTGDRLAEDAQINSWSMLSGGNTSVVDYDEKTKTATLVVSAISMDDNKDYGYLLNRFSSNEVEENYTTEVDWNKLIQTNPNWQKNRGGNGGYIDGIEEKIGISFDKLSRTSLEPKVLNEPISDNGEIVIENMAYKDNLLHILIKKPNTTHYGFISMNLYSKTTNEKLQSVASFQTEEETHNNETGMTAYEEYVFDIPESQLDDYGIGVELHRYEDVVKGNWAIQLKEPTEIESKNLGETTLSNKTKLSDIRLSGASLAFNYQNKSKDVLPLEVSVVQKNGDEKNILSNDAMYPGQENNEDRKKLIFDYIPLDDIKAVVINGQTIEVNE